MVEFNRLSKQRSRLKNWLSYSIYKCFKKNSEYLFNSTVPFWLVAEEQDKRLGANGISIYMFVYLYRGYIITIKEENELIFP